MLTSPFDNPTPAEPKAAIPEGTKIVFVSDMFKEDYCGGAELTTEALITSSPLTIFKLHSRDVNLELLEAGHKLHWIFGNFSAMDLNFIPTIVANMNYSILEYDYKFCRYRSPEKHFENGKEECNCHNEEHGKIISAFFLGAKSLWWMSEAQQKLYIETFPFLKERPGTVLSSVFDDTFFLALKLLRQKYEGTERIGWLVLGSDSWIKGTDDAIKWCEDNNKNYSIIHQWPYERVLEEMAQAEGFVYLPRGGDTCPRMVIEAKLLGCEVTVNDNVQHKDEIWFETSDMFDTEAYLFAARQRFWSAIMSTINYIPFISGYTTTLNCNDNQYPWKQSLHSLLGFCMEVVVVDGGSTDGTWDDLQAWSKEEERLKVYQVNRDWNDKRFAVFDGAQKAEARSRCHGEYCWQQDADEIVHENDYNKIINLARDFPAGVDLLSLPVIEYWGSSDKVRLDVNPWKWRLSKNKENITHGIPKELRKIDTDGLLYSAMGTDGCDYIHSETYERIPHGSFYTQEIHEVRYKAANGDKENFEKYQDWFNRVVELLPGVHHYSWFDISRKIRTYKNYWSKHWQSLYDIEQEDTPENNMFFDKSWVDVTEKEIDNMAEELAEKMGGWIFHSKVDFANPTPYLTPSVGEPEIMKNES